MKKLTSKRRENIAWHTLSWENSLKQLEAHKSGLDEKEVKKRLAKYGYNKLPETKAKSKLNIFFSQFRNPLIYILLAAAIISVSLSEISDASVIMIAVIMNTIIGYVEESKADQALNKIKTLITMKVKVLRRVKEDSYELELDSSELVPGDIILFSSGDRVPADVRLIEANELKINEASLTGESMPANKRVETLKINVSLAERENMAYMGTVIMNGNGQAVVCNTGLGTELGKVALMVSETEEGETPLQTQIKKFSQSFSIIVLTLCSLILIVGLIRGLKFLDIFLTSVALAVAAIPEGLVVSLTIILAIGMQRILKKNALVKKLVAAETLGSASVICMDKTGTITEGKMIVSHIVVEPAISEQNYEISNDTTNFLLKSPNAAFALEIGMLCNNTVIENPKDELHKWILHGDPTEGALYMAAIQSGLNSDELKLKLPRIKEIPFNEDSKYMITLHKKGTEMLAYIKGAPEVLIEKSNKVYSSDRLHSLTEQKRKILKKQYENLTDKGLRVLALGYKRITNFEKDEETASLLDDMIFVGFVGLKDPLRKDAKETINKCLEAGIHPIIITGDHKLTAKAIMEEVGIKVGPENILEGDRLDKMNDEELQNVIKKINVYARVSPRHKLRIIDAWQSFGGVVAMTGDGVNDAPAIKSADIGISLGSGTDVAKETADIILLDDSFKTIVDIINQGRIIFDNIRKVVLYLLSDSFSEIIIITGSLFFGVPLPVLPAQILWINLITDGFSGIAMALEPGEKEVEKERPRHKNEPILNLEMKILIFVIGTVTALILFLFFLYLFNQSLPLNYIRTVMFALLGVDSLIYVFSCRSLRKPFWRINFFSNKFLLFSILFGFFMQIIGVYLKPMQILLKTVPLSFMDWIIVLIFGIINIIAIEIVKLFFVEKLE